MKRKTWILLAMAFLLIIACVIAACCISNCGEEELQNVFTAKILEISDNGVLVEPAQGQWECSSADKISLGTQNLPKLELQEGDYVQITYNGQIMESYPAQIVAQDWCIVKDLRSVNFATPWLDKTTAQKMEHQPFGDIIISDIYADCFLAYPVIPMPYTIKLNGQLSEEWCVGDQVACTSENIFYDEDNWRMEADLLTIEQGSFVPEPGVCYKPVIYLYPEETKQVSVSLDLNGRLSCTYPAYQNGWHVTADPDGTLTDSSGKTYNYLYWEGEVAAQYDLSKGFCIKGSDTAAFLEEALEKLGLSRREANEFIVYWLPLMQENPYNVITFQTNAYEAAAQLEITPAPDTLIRVFMAWYPSDCYLDMMPQTLSSPERTGFTAIEWGGTQLP